MAPRDAQIIQKVNGRFLCADTVRFWSMFSVVALHCTRAFTLATPDVNAWSFQIASSFFKFATIAFFLVSGFLLEKDLKTCIPLTLLKRRLNKIFLPWLFWCSLFIAVLAAYDFVRSRDPFSPGASIPHALLVEASHSLTTTALWFVPNILFSLVVLLIFRRRLNSLYFGASLLAANLLYTSNIYTQWLPAHHTRALFGFIFYLWLGHYAATHLDGLNRILHRLSAPVLIGLSFITALLALSEARLLVKLNSVDPLNTLRPANQVFSVLVVLCLCKLPRPTWPRFVDVPRHTFGIYLSHAILVAFVLTCVRRVLEAHALASISGSLVLRTLLWIVATLIAWSLGFLLSRFLASKPALSWLVGLSKQKAPHAKRPRPHEVMSGRHEDALVLELRSESHPH